MVRIRAAQVVNELLLLPLIVGVGMAALVGYKSGSLLVCFAPVLAVAALGGIGFQMRQQHRALQWEDALCFDVDSGMVRVGLTSVAVDRIVGIEYCRVSYCPWHGGRRQMQPHLILILDRNSEQKHLRVLDGV